MGSPRRTTAWATRCAATAAAAVLFLTVGGPAVVSGASGSPAAAFKAHCSSRLTYRQLSSAQAPGQCVDEHGQVFQYRVGARGHSMLLDVTDTGGGIWDTAVDVRLPASRMTVHLSEGDIVEVWGTVSGTATTRTRFGGKVHVPLVDARYLKVLQSIATSVTTPTAT